MTPSGRECLCCAGDTSLLFRRGCNQCDMLSWAPARGCLLVLRTSSGFWWRKPTLSLRMLGPCWCSKASDIARTTFLAACEFLPKCSFTRQKMLLWGEIDWYFILSPLLSAGERTGKNFILGGALKVTQEHFNRPGCSWPHPTWLPGLGHPQHHPCVVSSDSCPGFELESI